MFISPYNFNHIFANISVLKTRFDILKIFVTHKPISTYTIFIIVENASIALSYRLHVKHRGKSI
jgi:hypothetical protein